MEALTMIKKGNKASLPIKEGYSIHFSLSPKKGNTNRDKKAAVTVTWSKKRQH
ncbi:hypothetical protein GIB67_040937 [Kingdonia uniflora]|uniref:Uncharacterized protein n=1 Tax=Kingdonia uniflora TaxID=39325 RepID=A0A7J7LY48_9MAGN|nr:hypothetical protein GIB67_040937 [Kingdonia uniflora]